MDLLRIDSRREDDAVPEGILLRWVLLETELRRIERVAVLVVEDPKLVVGVVPPRPAHVPHPAVLDVGEEDVLLPQRLGLLLLLRSEEHTSELQSRLHLVCRLLLSE